MTRASSAFEEVCFLVWVIGMQGDYPGYDLIRDNRSRCELITVKL